MYARNPQVCVDVRSIRAGIYSIRIQSTHDNLKLSDTLSISNPLLSKLKVKKRKSCINSNKYNIFKYVWKFKVKLIKQTD